MNMWLELVFWTSIFLIFYAYLIYPMVLMVVSAGFQLRSDSRFLFGKEERRITDTTIDSPNVAVIIAAFNEEKDIGARVNNLLNQDYPKERLTIYVGSDGSTDRTVEILNEFDEEQLKVHAFSENRGKISVLNDLVSLAEDASILVLSDANTYFEPDVVSRLVRRFSNDNTGAVCGELNLIDGDSKQNSDGLYWRYERLLKFHEGRIGGLLGANGANYAIRKELYVPLPKNTIVDDFAIVMDIAVRGYDVKYEPEAIAVEEVAPSLEAEFSRRVRIGTGNYLAFRQFLGFLKPRFSTLYLTYVSHKVCRWFVPHFMLTAFASNLLLIGDPFFRTIFFLQVTFYLAYFIIHQAKDKIKLPGIVMFPLFILSMNYALGVGFIRFISGNSKGTWKRTDR